MDFLIEKLVQVGAREVLIFLFLFVVVKLFMRSFKGSLKWEKKRDEVKIVSYKDPDNLPDLSKSLWKIRLQIILAAFSIIAFTTIAIINSF